MQKQLILVFGVLILSSCIDRITIVVPDSYSSQLVVDGLVTDEQGPYTVRLTRTTRIEKFLEFSQEKVTSAIVTIFDNVGNLEVLIEKDPGIYQTKATQGVVGREYVIQIQTQDGKVYESIPDKMNPVREIDNLYYEYETFQTLDAPTEYGFRFYIDTETISNVDNLVRWKFTGVYKIDAEPKLHSGFGCNLDPRPCSGLIFVDGGFKNVGECTCCTCWVTKYESKPHLSDNQFVSSGKIKGIEVGYVPIEFFPFQQRYRVEVKQMSLSREAYAYWRIIQSQKEGVASLFQPPTGKTRTNIFAKNGSEEVQGLFYASSIKTKQVYLTNKDVKVNLRVPLWDCEDDGTIAESCLLAFPNSSNQPPSDWK